MNAEDRMQEWVVAQAVEWFEAHRTGELSDARRKDFIDWLRASPAHVREYLALTGFAEDLKAVAGGLATSTDLLIERARREPDILHALSSADAPTAHSTPAATRSPQRRRFRAWAIAAGLVLSTLGIAWFSAWGHLNRTTYSTAHAEQRSWRLPDGSTVHLNSASKIKVRFDDRRRAVDLIQGQALFQVAKDSQRPFWVYTGDAIVKAVGTEFDVYRQTQRTLVSVVEGRVAVWRSPVGTENRAHDSAEPVQPFVQLDAGQQARIDRQSAEVSRESDDVRKTVAWLQRQVVFDHDSLSAAAAEFNRYTDIPIRIDESLTSTEISGIFSAYDAEAFIRFLEFQPDMHVARTSREVIVTPNAAR